ncbi:MAG: hypothetical protein ABI668_06935 [Sphingorhabdus sp.]
MRKIAVLLPFILLSTPAGCTAQGGEVESVAPAESSKPAAPLSAVKATEVRDQAALEKLRGNAGLTLQWISWEQRGILEVSQRGDVVHVKGAQLARDGKGRLEMEGDVLSIDTGHFIFRGQIGIFETPDAGRSCLKDGDSEFAITQGRKYWRMREFEWCDDLTDYVDIYF